MTCGISGNSMGNLSRKYLSKKCDKSDKRLGAGKLRRHFGIVLIGGPVHGSPRHVLPP